MRFTKIAEDAFKELQLNAGVLVNEFEPGTGALELNNILGATSGGINFKATPTFTDFGADIDNCPNNMKELMRLSTWDVSLSGTFITVDVSGVHKLIGAADIDISDNKVTPRNTLKDTDFHDIWWIGDYSDKNGASKGGFIAVHMMNALSTGGFQIQSGKETKGQFAFEFKGHYSLENQDTVPFEVYVKAGEDE